MAKTLIGRFYQTRSRSDGEDGRAPTRGLTPGSPLSNGAKSSGAQILGQTLEPGPLERPRN